jgi:cysteine-rich repeat protein
MPLAGYLRAVQCESSTRSLLLACLGLLAISCASDPPGDTSNTLMGTTETGSGDGDGDGDAGDGDGDGDGDPAGTCGDGAVNEGEQCDDGNDSNTDTCTTNCFATFCGDGIVHEGVEECDDGNVVDADACSNTCVAAACGDGVAQMPEGCDDGNADNTDACLDTCIPASCGDGFLQTDVEECDDGNLIDADPCGNDCLVGGELVWSAAFTGGQSSSAATCNGFNEYRASLIDSGHSFYQIQLLGSADPIGQTCTGPEADVLCKALGSGTLMSVPCGGRTWRVGMCGSSIEINADDIQCQCSLGWSVRPCMGAMITNWGGMNTATCNGPSQTLEVRCVH